MPSTVVADRAAGPYGSPVHRVAPRRALVLAIALATAGYLLWLVAAHRSEIDRAVLRVRGAQTRWLVAAIALEVVSQACAVIMQHRLLRNAGSTMGLFATARLVLAQNAIGLAVPGGPAFASVFSYRHIRLRGGTNAAAAAWVVAASSVVGTLALATWGAFTATGTSWLTVLAATLLVIVLGVLVLLARSPERLRRPMIAVARFGDSTWRRHSDTTSPARVDRRLAKLSVVHLGWRDWAFVALFALAVVAADCAVWICASHAMIALPARCARPGLTARLAQQCARFRTASTAGLLVAYSAGQAALALPLLPAGVGLVESFMTATLTAAKIRVIPALSAVLLYRAISVGGVVVVGGLMWILVKRDQRKISPQT